MTAARWQVRAAGLVAVVAIVAALVVALSAVPADAGNHRHPTTTSSSVPVLVVECPSGSHPVGTAGHGWICVPDTPPPTRPTTTTTEPAPTTTATSSVSLIPPTVLDAPAAAVPVEATPGFTG